MSEHLDYDLPLELNEDDLRYVLPETFADIATEKGWTLVLEENVDDNHYKILYVMTRPVPTDFDDGKVAAMQERIGIVDEDDEIIDDYGLWTEDVRVWKPGKIPGRRKILSESKRLYFEFRGFPTDQTMDIMQALMQEFQPEQRKGAIARFLGRLGLHGSS